MEKKIIFKENGNEKEINFDDLEDIEGIEFVYDDDDDDFEDKTIRGKIVGVTPFVCLIVYLLLGFYKNLWHPGWIIFLLIPIVPMFLKLFSKKSRSITGFLTMLIIATYFILGFLYNWWHPGWIMFLLIPIISIIFAGVEKDD